MLPRHRDVVATIQTSGHAGSLANPTIPLLRWNGAAQRLENCEPPHLPLARHRQPVHLAYGFNIPERNS